MRRALFTDTTERNLYMYQVDNAIIMAAGASSRFAPLSVEYPKALIEVRGEVLIERQIKQLQQAGIGDIYVVVGYMGHCFDYLQEKLGVHIVKNDAYLYRNNNSSIYAVKDIIKNSYICSADNYFTQNPFTDTVEESYYAAVYADGETAEWCMQEDQNGYITDVQVGGSNSWYMLGHVFWSEEFSRKFIDILLAEYDLPETAPLLWESIFVNHIDELKMKIRKYQSDFIFEFDTLDELRVFDTSYVSDTRSKILKDIASKLGVLESDIVNVTSYKGKNTTAAGVCFDVKGQTYRYDYEQKQIESL